VIAGPRYPRARVTEAHRPTPDEEIHVYPGDAIAIGEESGEYPGWLRCTTAGGRSSWVPEAYVRRRAGRGTVLTEYHSRELAARGGETVALLRELRGWAWVRSQDGREGWFPLEKLASDPVPDP
jgi:SH3-like domain-containing protein